MQISKRIERLEDDVRPTTNKNFVEELYERWARCSHPFSMRNMFRFFAAGKKGVKGDPVTVFHCGNCGLHAYLFDVTNASEKDVEVLNGLNMHDKDDERVIAEMVSRGSISHILYPPSEALQMEHLGYVRHKEVVNESIYSN